MIVNSVTLKNFRNFAYDKIYFEKGVNILVGKNGQGKTNVWRRSAFVPF